MLVLPAYEEALKKNNINYELYMYEGANHAFHNDTAPTRYNEAAAKLAWQRTLDFWKKYLTLNSKVHRSHKVTQTLRFCSSLLYVFTALSSLHFANKRLL